jgi:hypothetical protein
VKRRKHHATSRETVKRSVRARRSWLLIVALLATAAGPRASFYDPPSLATRHHPGDILRTEPFPGAPAGSTATRMLYVSTAPNGRAIAVSALVIVPSGIAPAQGRPVLAWLHPTTGVARGCAPTLGPDPFGQIQGLSAFLAAGDVVVATDYPGLGGPGAHPYLVGVSEARSALDAVRAAQHVPAAQAGRRFAAWRHSQGGHAALFVADIAASYAPELELVGVAAAAPVTDLAALIEAPRSNPLWAPLLSYTVWSWSHVFGLDPDTIVPPTTRGTVARTARDCLATAPELKRLLADAAPLHGLPVAPRGRWRTVLAEKAPKPWSSGVPAMLVQGDDDPVIAPDLSRDFARKLCGAHVAVRYVTMPGVDHYRVAIRSADAVARWIGDRFADAAVPDDCAVME